MSDTLVQVSAGDTKQDHPETLNVETAQPSLLKKGGLFGKSVAASPRTGDGSHSPVEKSNENGNEEPSSPSKNGESDSNANGDDVENDATNGDSNGGRGDDDDEDEVMAVDEPETAAVVEEDDEEEEEKAADEKPEAAAQPIVEEPEEDEDKSADAFDDVEMVDDIEEEDDDVAAEDEEEHKNEDETIASDKKAEDVVVPAEKEEDKKEEKEDDADEEEEKEEREDPEEPEDEEVAEEEECVKKVVSMDTDETEETKEEEEEAEEVSALDRTQDTEREDPEEMDEEEEVKEKEEEEKKEEKEKEEEKMEEEKEKEEEEKMEEEEKKEEVVMTPKRGRGRPPKSASSTPAAAKKTPARTAVEAADDVTDEAEDAPPPAKRASRGAGSAKKTTVTPSPASSSQTKGRGRRSIKSDTSSQVDAEEEKKEEGEAEEEVKEAAETEDEQEAKTPASRGRRSLKSTPATATRGTPRGKKAEKEEEEKEAEEKEEAKEEEEAVEEPEVKKATSAKRGRRSQVETPVVKETSSRASRSAKKEEKGGEEGEEEEVASSVSAPSSRRSTRGSPVKTATQSTPKGRGRKSSVKSSEATETAGEEEKEEEGEEKEEEEGEKVEKKGRGRGRKSIAPAVYTPSASPKKGRKSQEAPKEAEDPFDMDTELDKHPEPLRNITVERGSFGETKYTRPAGVSTSKYAATEKSASDKVANLPNTPAAVGTPKTIASAQSTRKSLGGTPVKRAVSSRKKKLSEGTEEDEEMEDIEEAAMETPADKKGRGRPAGSARKRKADDTPAAATSAKRAAPSVSIPTLDAEAQWAADHPEDDSAPLVPGARVFAVFQKVFYPALVGERDGLGRYMVEFVEDKIVRPVPPAGVVPLSAVTIDKECLYQSSADADPVECKVLQSANAANAAEWQAGAFRIREAGEAAAEHDAHWTTLQLDMATAEWKKYVNVRSKMTTRINTDNITSLEDRRERRSRVHNDTAVALATLVGTPEPSSRRSVVRKTPATAKAATPKTPYTGARRGRKPKSAAATPADKEEEPKEEEESEEKMEEEEEEEEKMDTEEKKEAKKPEFNPRIFQNKTFILTSANRTVTEVQFKKNEMKKQILERGGIVVEDINQVTNDAEAYLISDTHYRTHKYLAAMSRGMPCLSHMWLVECVAREELAPYEKYKLAGGQGLLDGELYPLPDVRGKLLVGRSIMVHSKSDASQKRGTMGFKQIWSPIVELLGATVVSDACLVDSSPEALASLVCPEAFEILLTDSSCPPEVVQKLEKSGKAVVSSEWLIQSIIMGECPNFTAHPRFRYDSGNEPTQKKEGSQEQAHS